MEKLWDNGRLQVMDNGHYFANGDKPLFWIGDTAWTLFQKMSVEEGYRYLRNRKDKGFNFIYCTLINFQQRDEDTSFSLSGDKDVSEFFDENHIPYWEEIHKVVKRAEELGLYLGLLPVWGNVVKSERLHMDNVQEYVDFLYENFKDYKNIVWVVGGDNRGDQFNNVWNALGEKIKEKMPDHLVGYHPFGRTSSSYWFHDEEWLDFNMFQSGHRRTEQRDLGAWDEIDEKEPWHGERNYRYVQADYKLTPAKPVLDGEPSYEQIPQGLHDPVEPYWQDYHVRRYAYWSSFAGAAGHIYGHNAIIQFYGTGRGPVYGAKETWDIAMHDVGAAQMKILKDVMDELNFAHGVPMQEYIENPEPEVQEESLVAFGTEEKFACYNYGSVDITLKKLTGDYDCYWIDPVSGVKSYHDTVNVKENPTFTVPNKKSTWNDWILLLEKVK